VARGDWAIHRGGDPFFMEGAEIALVADCSFEYIGGNGVFMSNFTHRNNTVQALQICTLLAESAVLFCWPPSAVRFYADLGIDSEIAWERLEINREHMDMEPGPKTPD